MNRNILIVRHGHLGEPIEVCIVNPDTNETMTAIVKPHDAGQQGLKLIKAAMKELAAEGSR